MIFLDNNSTTKLDERVFEKMVPFLKENYGNPHSNFHNFGLLTRYHSSRMALGFLETMSLRNSWRLP